MMTGTVSKRMTRSLWMTWERVFEAVVHRGSPCKMQYGICKVVVKKHKGADIVCGDGTCVRRGDWIAELHLDNAEVLKHLGSAGADRAALRIARSVKGALEDIHSALESRQECRPVKALIGVTLLHRGLTHGLGFEQHRLHSRFFEWTSTWYLRLLLAILHPEGKTRIGKRTEHLVPMMLVHTRRSLQERFGAKPPIPFSAVL